MTEIIDTICKHCGKKQKMEIRFPKYTEFNKLNLKDKRKTCVRCEKSFKLR